MAAIVIHRRLIHVTTLTIALLSTSAFSEQHSVAYEQWSQAIWNRVGTASANNRPPRGCTVGFTFDDSGYVTTLDVSKCSAKARIVAAGAIFHAQPFPAPPLEPGIPQINTITW